jgi:hypothetical protein
VLSLLAALMMGLTGAGCAPVTVLGARQMPAADGAQDHVLAGALHGRKVAFLIVRDAASRVEVRLAPAVTGPPGRVRLGLRSTGADGPDTVEILLNRTVRWDIRLPAGAGEQHLDLAAGRLSRLELGSGTGLVSMRLPAPRGTVPIIVAGGVGEVAVAIPPGTPLRLHLRGGAGLVAVPWAGRTRASTGAVFAPATWREAADRYTVSVASEVGSVTVWG